MDNQFLAFDALELRNKIVDKLNNSQIFTDQNFQGSNISAIIDIISMAFGSLQFYNSKTSSESMFSEAQIYENMNRIVKILNYNPIGKTSQSVPFTITASSDLSANSYVIPRYSYTSVGGTIFTVTQDIGFTKQTAGTETIADLNHTYMLREGSIQEYDIHSALGIENEVVYIATGDDVYIDHLTIDAYVMKDTQMWKKWTRVENLSLYSATDKVYEVRYNANKRYEILFGDDINGQKLDAGDQVAIYFLKINPGSSSIGPHALRNNIFVPFNSRQFSTIFDQTKSIFGTYFTFDKLNFLSLDNLFPSSQYSDEESVESIRKKAPKSFRSQQRLITTDDYNYFANNNFSNIIKDSKVIDNDTYLNTHLKYLYSIGLSKPQLETQILLNQVKFANSCNFNNVYIYSIPKNSQKYLLSAQKEVILKEINRYKGLGVQIVPMDPEYMLFDFYLKDLYKPASTSDILQTTLRIHKNPNTRRSSASIKFDVVNLIKNYFGAAVLGYDINTHQLTTDIIGIDGVDYIDSYRKDTDTVSRQLSFLVWNSKYPTNDINVYTQTIYLDDFKYPLLNNVAYLADRIEVVDLSYSVKIADF